MEKYAVEIDRESTKIASDATRCNNCSTKLEIDSNVPKCPKCGTEPRETKSNKN